MFLQVNKIAQVVSVFFAFALSACSTSTQTNSASQAGPNLASQTPASIKVDGFSTVYPLTNAVAKAFKQANPSVEIEVAFSGTTSGFRK